MGDNQVSRVAPAIFFYQCKFARLNQKYWPFYFTFFVHMNFLRNRSLRQLGIYALLLIVAVFTLQFLGIRRSIQSLEEAERKIDFARTIQIKSQQLALQTQRFINGNKDLGSDIVANLEHQNHNLDVLVNGGRLDGTKF